MAAPAGVFEALGDPVRRRILELLGDGERPAGAVAAALHDAFAISQPATSQHLRVLRSAGLVSVRAEGTRRMYAVEPDGLEPVRRWLSQFPARVDPAAEDPFAQPLDALATELARGQRARRRAAQAQGPEGDDTAARGAGA